MIEIEAPIQRKAYLRLNGQLIQCPWDNKEACQWEISYPGQRHMDAVIKFTAKEDAEQMDRIIQRVFQAGKNARSTEVAKLLNVSQGIFND